MIPDEAEIAGRVLAVERVEKQHLACVGLAGQTLEGGGGTKWVITPPSNACDATANSIYCYGVGNVGVHVLSAAVSVGSLS